MGLLSRSRRIVFPDGELRSLRFPGRWMDDAALDALRAELAGVARERLGDLPAYGVFAGGRAPFRDRVVNLLYRRGDVDASAFSALVHCPLEIDGQQVDVINLGLAIARRDGRQRTPLLSLYWAPLLQHWLLRGCRPFWIVTFTAKPRTLGVITDAFTDVWPDYRGGRAPSARHLAIAAAVFARGREESGVGPQAWFDPDRAVVHASCTGPSALLREAFAAAPKHRVAAANEYCRARLDYDAGDEFLLVGRADFGAAWRSVPHRLARGPC